jgi:hypothetical protein
MEVQLSKFESPRLKVWHHVLRRMANVRHPTRSEAILPRVYGGGSITQQTLYRARSLENVIANVGSINMLLIANVEISFVK